MLNEEHILEFLKEHRQLTDIGTDTPLFSDGTIDSLGMIDLISFIETSEGIEIGHSDVTLENFDTVARIITFLGQKVTT